VFAGAAAEIPPEAEVIGAGLAIVRG